MSRGMPDPAQPRMMHQVARAWPEVRDRRPARRPPPCLRRARPASCWAASAGGSASTASTSPTLLPSTHVTQWAVAALSSPPPTALRLCFTRRRQVGSSSAAWRTSKRRFGRSRAIRGPCILCAGTHGLVSLEDILVAGAFVEAFIHDGRSIVEDDTARPSRSSPGRRARAAGPVGIVGAMRQPGRPQPDRARAGRRYPVVLAGLEPGHRARV